MTFLQPPHSNNLNNKNVERPECILIVGHGRSGTNWLLELFDLSAETFCRNEPDRSPGTPLDELSHDRTICRANQSALHLRWDDAVRWCSTHRGRVDHLAAAQKNYINSTARNLGLWRTIQSSQVRKILGLIAPSLRNYEWSPPRFICNPVKLSYSIPTLKLVQIPGWATFVLRHRPRTRVFHIVRHPGGFINSWSNRYLSKRDSEAVRKENHIRLMNINSEEPNWATRFGDINSMSIEESELWYWCYATEKIHEAGQGREGYTVINYDHLALDPITVTRESFLTSGLSWSQSIEDKVHSRSEHSETIARSWRTSLQPESIKLVERILNQTSLRAWWDDIESPHNLH